MEFDIQYSRLNKAQKEAVDAIEGPIMVIAGPGTGKTTILTLRIANILKTTDTPAHGILAITYTDAGVKAMREKLIKLIGNRAHEVKIHTFHSFASSIIAEYPDHFLHIKDTNQMTDVEQESLIRSIIKDKAFSDLRPMARPDNYIKDILTSISESKKDNKTPEMVASYAKEEIKKTKNDESSISTRGQTKGELKAEAKKYIEKCEKTILFSKVFEKYEEEKIKAKKLDFDDLILELILAFKRDELLLRLIQERFLYIHVDEHQDTNDSQNTIISIIAEFFDTPNIFIVGDEKQAIYRFQGASVENFLLLKEHWPAMKVISLDTNYRSHQNILDASFGMIENNYEENENKELRIRLSGRKSKDKIKLISGENTVAEKAFLIKELQNIIKNNQESSVAIITRRNKELDQIIELLETNNIPVFSERSIDIFHHPIGSIFFDLIEYLEDPTKVDLLSKTIVSGLWNMDFDQSTEIIKLLKSGKEVDFEKKMPALIEIKNELLKDNPVGFIIFIAEKSGYERLVIKDPANIHVWRGIVALTESISRDRNLKNPIELLKALIEYRTSAESRKIKITVGASESHIQAMTAHGSKGLEFDYVFIPFANEENWIGKSRGNSFVLPRKQVIYSDINDTRRLFYVALTRAKQGLYISFSLEEQDGKFLTPLRFINELDSKFLENISLPREDIRIIPTKTSKDHSTSKVISLAKNILLEKGISVTALNHFIKCPNEFIYKSILKLPQPSSINAEKGNAMHEAFSQIWKSENRSKKDIERIIEETVAEHVNNSFLPSFEKEIVKNELIENAPEVAKALENHFKTEGAIFSEHWVKTIYHGKYMKQNIDIPLHGKLDAIIDNKSEVSVFDYKTKQSMSDNEIKGETKSGTGDYWRQLIFYKILLKDDYRFKDKRIIPNLVFISPDEKGRCPIKSLPIEEKDIEKVKDQIQSLINNVWSGEIINNFCDDKDCEWCRLKKVNPF